MGTLTMTYFHGAWRPTSIGAEAFHGPVRNGKAWDHLAMVVREDGVHRSASRSWPVMHWEEALGAIAASSSPKSALGVIGSSLTGN